MVGLLNFVAAAALASSASLAHPSTPPTPPFSKRRAENLRPPSPNLVPSFAAVEPPRLSRPAARAGIPRLADFVQARRLCASPVDRQLDQKAYVILTPGAHIMSLGEMVSYYTRPGRDPVDGSRMSGFDRLALQLDRLLFWITSPWTGANLSGGGFGGGGGGGAGGNMTNGTVPAWYDHVRLAVAYRVSMTASSTAAAAATTTTTTASVDVNPERVLGRRRHGRGIDD
ncbi:hypothetical protein FRC06_006597 [Ceratobasidium sp. 370]|nr:hypothetical protein FRC06_006597 [Ceratobasidium sp. 370]